MKKGLKVFFSGFDEDFHLDAIDRLVSDHQLVPLYFLANVNNQNRLASKYPNAIYHKDFDAFRGIFPTNTDSIPNIPLDQILLEKMSPYHHIVITMMDRLDPVGDFFYRDRVNLFYALFQKWNSILQELKPDFVIFHQTPHLVYDYVLYLACLIGGVKTVLLNWTSLPGLYVLSSTYNGESPIGLAYKKLLAGQSSSAPGLSQNTLNYLEKIKGAQTNALPQYVVDNQKKEHARADHSPLRTWAKNLKQYFLSFNTPFRPTYLKRPGHPITNSAWTHREYLSYKSNANRKKAELRAYYQSVSKDPNPNNKYIFLPLQFQPEKTTSPEADYFVDQLLMISLLSETIPADLKIYVKEHQTQFFETWHGEKSAKNLDFYEKLQKIKNVVLIKLECPSFSLIDNSIACCTTTGTAGWEAILRSKPTLLFGYPWYRDCEGVFQIRSIQDCRDALKMIGSGYQIDERKVNLFLRATEETCCRGYIYGRLEKSSGVSYTDNLNTLVKSISDFIKGSVLK